MSLLKDKRREEQRNITFAAFVRDAASEEELTRFLKGATLGNFHVGRGNIDAAIAWLLKAERSPQRLLVDISGSEGPLDELDRLADACEPSVQVFVVGDRNDVGLYRSLLQRGIQDYLVKPLNIELLRRSLSDGSARQARHGKVIAMIGTRGGTGVTTVAAHLSRHLAHDSSGRRRVAYVDLDLFGGPGPAILGLAGGDALFEVLSNVNRLDPQYLDRTLSTQDNRLYSLGAELSYDDIFTPEPGALGELLNMLGQHFHYVVLDLPKIGGPLANEALDNSNMVCLLTDFSTYSGRTLTRMLRHIEGRPKPPTVYLVSNSPRSSDKGSVNQREFSKAIEIPIVQHIPHDPREPMLAENLGEELPERSEFNRSMAALAALLTGERSAAERKKRSGLLARLRKED